MSNKNKNLPELNFKVIFIGIILSIVMGAANVYLGLKAGMTVSASIPASVLGMLVLRYINNITKNKSDTILEANQIQTAASAGESLAAGIIFTMPALIIIGIWQEFDMILTTIIAFTGGLLGILFMIPIQFSPSPSAASSRLGEILSRLESMEPFEMVRNRTR